MPRPFMSPIIFWSIIGIAIVVFFITGIFITRTAVEIDGCRAEWLTGRLVTSSLCPGSNETYNATCEGHIVTSPLCPGSNATYNATCLAQVFVDQHNALVDALLCACAKAKVDERYPNTELNKRIVDVYKEMTGQSVDVTSVCEAGVLTKWSYR